MPQPTKQMLSEVRPPKPHFTGKDLPDLAGQVAIVTGGNSGIGLETIVELLQRDAKVYMASRSENKAKEAIEEIHQRLEKLSAPKRGTLKFLQLDLANLSSVKKAADEFKSQEKQLNMLFASAGVMAPPAGSKTEQGYELQIGTNVLGHHLFFTLLVPTLEAAVSAQGPGAARVCFTSSSGHNMHHPKGFVLEDAQWKNPGIVSKWKHYGHSKFLNVVQAQKYQKLYEDKGFIITSCNPGNLRTNLARHGNPFETLMFAVFVRPLILYPSWYGALSQLYACAAPLKETHGDKGIVSISELKGAYLVPWARITKPDLLALDAQVQDDLLVWLDEQSKSYL